MEHIHAEMTVLDVVSKYRETEAVFKQYDQQAGECNLNAIISIEDKYNV